MKCPECNREMCEAKADIRKKSVAYVILECLVCGIQFTGMLDRKDPKHEISSSK
jgi:transcription elongation factor Elf1